MGKRAIRKKIDIISLLPFNSFLKSLSIINFFILFHTLHYSLNLSFTEGGDSGRIYTTAYSMLISFSRIISVSQILVWVDNLQTASHRLLSRACSVIVWCSVNII